MFYKNRHPEHVGSQVAFSTDILLWFSGGSDPRSARAGAVETQFLMFDVAFKSVSFLIAFRTHFWYIWRRNPLKRHFKIELENKSWKSVCVFCFLSLFCTLLDTLWGVFSRLWGVSALKKARFSQAWGPGLATKGGFSPCLGPLALQKYCVFSSRAPMAMQKRPSSMLAPGSGRQASQKKGPSSFKLGSAT